MDHRIIVARIRIKQLVMQWWRNHKLFEQLSQSSLQNRTKLLNDLSVAQLFGAIVVSSKVGYEVPATRILLTIGVKIPSLDSTCKSDLTPCSQVARRNVTDEVEPKFVGPGERLKYIKTNLVISEDIHAATVVILSTSDGAIVARDDLGAEFPIEEVPLLQEVDFYRTRESGSLPKNDLMEQGKNKEFKMQWLRKPAKEHRENDLYRNLYLPSIVGHGSMGKTTFLPHVYKDEMTVDFNLKKWVCTSNNFDVKKIIVDMLEHCSSRRMNFEEFCAAVISPYRLEVLEGWEQMKMKGFEYFEQEGNMDLRVTSTAYSIVQEWITKDILLAKGKLESIKDVISWELQLLKELVDLRRRRKIFDPGGLLMFFNISPSQ